MSTTTEDRPRGKVRKLWHVRLKQDFWRWRCSRCHKPGAWSGNFRTQQGALTGALRHLNNIHSIPGDA